LITRSKFSSSLRAGMQTDMSGVESGDMSSDARGLKPILFLRRTTDVKRRNSKENDVSQNRVKGKVKRRPDYVIMNLNVVICSRATIL